MAVTAPERTSVAPPPPPARRSLRAPRRRLDPTPPAPTDRLLSWVLTAVLGVATLVSRVWGISYPPDLLFDEAYYPPEANEMLEWGYEFNRGYTFIVHPPLGKWFIALGEQVFGYDSVGWRVPSAVAGTIAVVVLVRLARRLTGSTLWGVVAGLLLALDGFAFTLSRIGLLDVFLQALVVSGVACLVVDRDRVRATIRAGVLEHADRVTASGFALGPRTWRIAGGFLLGSACAVKWSGVYFLAFFAVASLFWDRASWRAAGVARPSRVALLRGLPGAAWALGVLPVLTYLATFTGWFLGESSQGRHWAEQNPDTSFGFVPGALRSLWHMHGEWLAFHNGLSSPHPWESGPWSWVVDGRPILLWNPQDLTDGDGNPVVRYILMVGTPTLWFAFVPALLWLLWRIVARRDAAAGVAAVGIAAGWLTWFVNLDRTMFIFYMAPVLPFFVIAVTLALQDVLGPTGRVDPTGTTGPTPLRRQLGLGAVCLYVTVVAATFVFFLPVLTGHPLPTPDWQQRMWFPSWY
ncbi:phospholipid carrier-dependent glycosyltransferase [Modestobacter sp. I12A-02628]|uniref:Polyprenol-phosphate-mannose--protein mannosyltransferase n=1 Tax=Goekera deserti TaxID=2497753 RepID=A0A7K3WGK8_9ACTN|nr:phospholipid carrier-dependent glycosyltransferase [Goekera deserti]MPQ99401.1 phospholipid carrier-dependent glycosyltransferase [Goekera deserti]NDI48888.1 phospholipid carrier-dependent glycosyltransferase [Goekera deserti]NEL55641.1 phospholipid carrier-dependent glycosyltransferase [Goekera deserti]